MEKRRAIGALESEVMAYLWATRASATPSEVHAAIAPNLAYTTVMTVLTRLWKKGLLERERVGRAFAYTATTAESVHRAGQMRSALANSQDRAAVLSSFVDALDAAEAAVLRGLLESEME